MNDATPVDACCFWFACAFDVLVLGRAQPLSFLHACVVLCYELSVALRVRPCCSEQKDSHNCFLADCPSCFSSDCSQLAKDCCADNCINCIPAEQPCYVKAGTGCISSLFGFVGLLLGSLCSGSCSQKSRRCSVKRMHSPPSSLDATC